jgi:ABC-type nitrate/sulfonate/bicarbonate transport system substrate-binding protein
MNRRRTLAAALGAGILTAALALSGCASSSTAGTSAAPGSLGSLTLQLPWILNSQFIGEYLAQENGYYTDAGLSDVQLVTGPSSTISEVLSGTADLGMIDAVSIASTIVEQGAPLKIIASTYQKNPYSVMSLDGPKAIRTPKDLIGKKIGVQDVNVALFNALLAANSIPKDQVTVVPVQYDPSPLTLGEVDGYMSFLTNESILVPAEGFKTVDMPFADNGLPFVADAVIATDDMIANHRDALKAFLEGDIRGYTAALHDPQKGIDLMMKQSGQKLGLNADTELLCAEAANTELIVTDETAKNGLFTTSDALQAQTIATLKTIGLNISASQLFDMSLLSEVYAAHPELVDYAKK